MRIACEIDPDCAHLLGEHHDERGDITDLIGHCDSVTEIVTHQGAVRGNHVHKFTTQWAYVVSGKLLVVTGTPGRNRLELPYGPGEISVERPGVPHAWKALEDTTVLVFTRGPRSGENYENDTTRLEVPLL